MKVVSNKYKNTMNMLLRPTSQFRASLEMIDRTVETDSTVTVSLKESFATSVLDTVHECDYITHEKDYFVVGGSQLILPESNFLRNGYVSSVLTDENGVFKNAPTVELILDKVRDFAGFTYTFSYDYPKDIRVTAFLNGNQVWQFMAHPDSLNFVDDKNHLPECDRITMEFLSMYQPYRRLRVNRIVFGLVKVFNTDDVLGTDHNVFIDPISTSLPYDRLTMRIVNLDKDYNPDNPHGMWEYFRNGQPIKVQYGVEVGEENEWVDAAYLYLSDAPTVENNSATFVANDALSYLTGTYYKGLWREEGISLYDLAQDVLNDAGVRDYSLPIQLKDVITYAPIPALSHRECLQIIANAGRCVLHTDIEGRIVMEVQLNADATITDNGHMPWADADRTLRGNAPYDYITFEPNKWRMGNDKYLILPDSEGEYKQTCFISEAMSNGQGKFLEPPKLFVAYSLPVSSYQFQIGFDSLSENYASEFNLRFTRDGELVKRVEVRENTEILYTLNEEVIDFTDVEIEILATARPYQRVRVESINQGKVTDFYLDFNLALNKPIVRKSEELKSVEVSVNAYKVPTSRSVIYSANGVDIAGERQIQVTYAPSTEIEATVTGGTLIDAVFYAENGFLTIQGEGEVNVEITGLVLIKKQSVVSVGVNKTGMICPLNNPIISTAKDARDVGEWVANYLKCRNTYETTFRQDFRVDANDVIYIQSEFEEMIPARVTKVQWKLPGQTGAISVRRLK